MVAPVAVQTEVALPRLCFLGAQHEVTVLPFVLAYFSALAPLLLSQPSAPHFPSQPLELLFEVAVVAEDVW